MEALKVFAEHYPWESTLLLILNKACLKYLRPRMCWKQAYGLDRKFLDSVDAPHPAELAARHGYWNEFCNIIFHSKLEKARAARIIGKYCKPKGLFWLAVDWDLISCAAVEYGNMELIYVLKNSNAFSMKCRWEFETYPIKTLDHLKSLGLIQILHQVAKNAIGNDNLELLEDAIQRSDTWPLKGPGKVGPRIGKWMFEKGHCTASHDLLITMICSESFGFAKEILDRVGWRPHSMLCWFEDFDDDDDGPSQLNWMLENGCPWELTEFYKNPSKYYELSFVMEQHGLGFDQATMDDLCRRATRENRLFGCAVAIAQCRIPYGYDLDTTLLTQTAARLGKAELLQVQQYPFDGQLWEVAVLSKCSSAIDFFESIQLPWKSKFPVDWSRLCSVGDWRFLHNAGSPCRLRHRVLK